MYFGICQVLRYDYKMLSQQLAVIHIFFSESFSMPEQFS